MNKQILPWIVVGALCFGCKQSNSSAVADVKQMTFAELKSAAERGNPQAQFEMGERLHSGKDAPRDSSEAVEWWQKAATQGYPPAQYDLGVAYGHGDGVPKDVKQGLKWMNLAATSGLSYAKVALGIFYLRGGDGITQDQARAFQLFKESANQGWPVGQYYLALCFRDGKGTLPDKTNEVLWLQQAANNGLANAQLALGQYYFNTGFDQFFAVLGISVPTNGFPIQIPVNIKSDDPRIKEAHDNTNFFLGVAVWREAANQGDPGSQEYLANACANGFGTDKDPVEAYKWLVLAGDKESNVVAILLKGYHFTSEQISAGQLRAEEFSKTNHVKLKRAPEIPGL